MTLYQIACSMYRERPLHPRDALQSALGEAGGSSLPPALRRKLAELADGGANTADELATPEVTFL